MSPRRICGKGGKPLSSSLLRKTGVTRVELRRFDAGEIDAEQAFRSVEALHKQAR